MINNNRISLGEKGEKAVGSFLEKKGFKILDFNFSVRDGEIDIIAERENTIAFVEVKTRKINYFHTSNVITKSKQKKIIKAAKKWLLLFPHIDKVHRFDVALVTENSDELLINYIPNAFNEGSF